MCFTCSLDHSKSLDQLKHIELIGNGAWQVRANRGMFLDMVEEFYEIIIFKSQVGF